jgi:hypothetical protein
MGTRIMFFEVYWHTEALDYNRIPHYKGIIPLTQKMLKGTSFEDKVFWEKIQANSIKDDFLFPYPELFGEETKETYFESKHFTFELIKSGETICDIFDHLKERGIPRDHLKFYNNEKFNLPQVRN